MFNIKNKYLGIQPDVTANEIGVNSLFFYVIPELLLSSLFSLAIVNHLSFLLGYVGLIILAIVVTLLSLFLQVLAILNVIVILDKDYKKNYSKAKKILLFFLMWFPYAAHANFLSIYITKKSSKYKYQQLFIVSLIIICVTFTLLTGLISQQITTNLQANLNPKDGAPIMEPKITKVKSDYIGKSYIIKSPLFVQLNLPKGARFNSSSVLKAEGALTEFKNSCANCLDSKRLEKPITMKYLRIGSKITVVDSFEIKNRILGLSSHKYLIVKDSNDTLSEISELGFKVNVIDSKDNYDNETKDLFDEIDIFKKSDKIACARKDEDEILKTNHPFKYNNHIGRKLYRFINDFALKDQVEIKAFYEANNNKSSCAHMTFKTINAIALTTYYGGDWGLDDKLYDLEDFDRIQNSEATTVNYNEYINKSDEEILNLYP